MLPFVEHIMLHANHLISFTYLILTAMLRELYYYQDSTDA